MARAKEKAAGAESPEQRLYVVASPVQDGRGRHDEGAIVGFDDDAAAPLLACGAIQPFVDVAAGAAADGNGGDAGGVGGGQGEATAGQGGQGQGAGGDAS